MNASANIPNILSASRLIMAPLMIVAAIVDSPHAFAALYAANLLTDALDGFLARRMHVESELGATLDSRGDFAVAMCLPIAAFLLWPDMMRGLMPYILTAICAYLAPIAAGEIRYGRMPSFHTWGAKSMAVLTGAALFIMFLTQNTIYFRICVPFMVLESLEELIMIAILPKRHPNTPTLWHAIKILKQQA
jgi:CDP-diacylglycerol--glycerol-3-phosphate 3-phosphatidyltransferase